MKVISLILAIFTVTLTMFPCEDALFVSTVGDAEITNSHKHGHEKHDGVDYCSPFCSCAISNVVEIDGVFDENALKQTKKVEIPAFYLDPYSNEVLNSIFQPPRC